MNGSDLADTLEKLHPRLKRLFMSGYTANVIATHGVLEDERRFIAKPFALAALAAKVRACWIASRTAGQPARRAAGGLRGGWRADRARGRGT